MLDIQEERKRSGLFTVHEGSTDAPWRGICSCSTTSSLTCSRPTSSSSMLRRSILPRFTASARIARAPIARAPSAVAPTAIAPRPTAPVASRPTATLPYAACVSEERFARIFIGISFPLSTFGSACCPPWMMAPSDEADAQRQEPHRQQEPGDEGEVDHGVGLRGLLGGHREEEAQSHQHRRGREGQ